MSIHEEARVARDVGLAGISLFGSLTAIFLGVFLLYTEVQRRTIHAIVSKPIERWEFVVGKYLGMVVVLTCWSRLFAIAMVVMLALQGVGVSSGGRQGDRAGVVRGARRSPRSRSSSRRSRPRFCRASSRSRCGCSAASRPISRRAIEHGAPWIRTVARVALEIVPDLHLFSPSGRVVDGATVSVHADFVTWGYVGLASLHGLGWIVGLLALACLLFQRRDFA